MLLNLYFLTKTKMGGIENSNHNAKRKEGSPILPVAINQALSPDMKEEKGLSIEEEESSTPKQRTAIREEKIREKTEKRERRERIDKIADFFKLLLPGWEKREIVEELKRNYEPITAYSRENGIVVERVSQPDLQSVDSEYEAFAKIMLDYPTLFDNGKVRLSEFRHPEIDENGRLKRGYRPLSSIMSMMVDNYDEIEKIKLDGSLPDNIVQDFEVYAANMYRIVRVDYGVNHPYNGWEIRDELYGAGPIYIYDRDYPDVSKTPSGE